MPIMYKATMLQLPKKKNKQKTKIKKEKKQKHLFTKYGKYKNLS